MQDARIILKSQTNTPLVIFDEANGPLYPVLVTVPGYTIYAVSASLSHRQCNAAAESRGQLEDFEHR